MAIKIVLSRKGCDTVTGKIASPIFENKFVSIPIPVNQKESEAYSNHNSNIDSNLKYKYDNILDEKTKDIIENIYPGWLKENEFCHYDPCFKDGEGYIGQCGPNATYLENAFKDKTTVIFLFFGRFHEVIKESDKYKLNPETSDIHMIWGYLIVNERICNNDIKESYKWHPHSADYYSNQDDVNTKNNPNYLFKGNGGILPYNESRILTFLEQRKNNKPTAMSIWDKKKFCKQSKPEKKLPFQIVGERVNSASDTENELYLKGQWQELIMTDNDECVAFLTNLNLKCILDQIPSLNKNSKS